MDETLRLWGSNIKRRREALQMTQDQLAKSIGVQQPTVFRWERGQMEPSRHNKTALAAALRLDAQTLFPLIAAAS